jgi:hypothetical protein
MIWAQNKNQHRRHSETWRPCLFIILWIILFDQLDFFGYGESRRQDQIVYLGQRVKYRRIANSRTDRLCCCKWKARGDAALPLDNTNTVNTRHNVSIRRLSHTQFCLSRYRDIVQGQPLAPRCRWQPKNGSGKRRSCPQTSPRSSPHHLSASERWTPWRAWDGTGNP